jgi:hypothetical protein
MLYSLRELMGRPYIHELYIPPLVCVMVRRLLQLGVVSEYRPGRSAFFLFLFLFLFLFFFLFLFLFLFLATYSLATHFRALPNPCSIPQHLAAKKSMASQTSGACNNA